MPANRKVALLGAAVSLALALAPVVADLDWTSTAGVLAGVVAVLGIVNRWLVGWQAHEARSVDDETEFQHVPVPETAVVPDAP